MTQWPYERPVTCSVSALLTGSSRQRLNGFIGSTPVSLGLLRLVRDLLLCAKHLLVASRTWAAVVTRRARRSAHLKFQPDHIPIPCGAAQTLAYGPSQLQY